MSSLLQAAQGYESLLRVQDPRLPYRFERIFEGEGLRARWLARRRLKLLRRLDEALQRMLEDGERVEAVSWGVEFSLLEAWFMGLWHHLLNRRAVVLTERRLLLLQIDSRGRLRDLKSQIRLEAIRRVSGGGPFGSVLRLELRNQQKVALSGLPRRDRRALRQRLDEQLRRPEITQRTAHAASRQHLCPHCYAPVKGLPERCPTCAGAFKSASRAGWLSLALPGLGDLYLGHRALALLEIAGALAVWAVVAPATVAAFREQGAAPEQLAWLALPLGAIFLGTHGVDAWITRRTGRKGLYPAR